MPSENATSYFHQGSTITYFIVFIFVVFDLRVPCKGNIEGASVYVSISRAQSWHQIYLLHELWPKNDDTPKLRYIQKATKSFAYDEDTKSRKRRLDKLAISTTEFYGENHHLHYFTQENFNISVVCGAAACILEKTIIETSMIVIFNLRITF
jgi:hypothetical protein